jgi:hypothetical protein
LSAVSVAVADPPIPLNGKPVPVPMGNLPRISGNFINCVNTWLAGADVPEDEPLPEKNRLLPVIAVISDPEIYEMSVTVIL